jgi:hypothetical protein
MNNSRSEQIKKHIDLTSNVKLNYANSTKYTSTSGNTSGSQPSESPEKRRVMEHVQRTMG